MPTAQALYQSLVDPGSAMPEVARSGRFLPALLAATAAAVLLAAVAVPRLDFSRAADETLDRGPDAAQMTPRQREDAIAAARKLGALTRYAGALFGPALSALGAAVALWLGFTIAGGRPGFRSTFAVASFAQLPGALRQLLAVPAALRAQTIDPAELPRMVPSSLGALLPPGASGPGASFLFAFDLFGLWAVALVALGMTQAAQVSRRRAAATAALLWLAWVAVFEVALPRLGGAR